MKITREIFDKMNELDETFSNVETLSRVLTLYEDINNEIQNYDRVILIELLFEKILVMKNQLDAFTSLLLPKK